MTKEWKIEKIEQCELAAACGEEDFWSIQIDDNFYRVKDDSTACLVHSIMKCSNEIYSSGCSYETGEIKKALDKICDRISDIYEKL